MLIVLFTNISLAEMSDLDISTSRILAYDHEGKPITEDDIREYLVNNYKDGCCLLGTVVGSAVSFLLGCAVGVYLEEAIESGDILVFTWFAVWGFGTAGSVYAGSKAGEAIDRQKAINL